MEYCNFGIMGLIKLGIRQIPSAGLRLARRGISEDRRPPEPFGDFYEQVTA